MNTSELRTIASELDDGRSPQDVPIAEVSQVLLSDDLNRATAAARVLSEVANRQASLLEPAINEIADVIRQNDPLLSGLAMNVFAAVAEYDATIVLNYDGRVAQGLKAEDPTIRTGASRAIAALAEADPDSVAASDTAWHGLLQERVNDPVPEVSANVLRTLSEIIGTHDLPARTTDSVAERLSVADYELRHSALYFFATLAMDQPGEVLPYLEQVSDCLRDPFGPHRGLAAAVIANVSHSEPNGIDHHQCSEELAMMLSDPDPTAQQNASNALINIGIDSPELVATADVGTRLQDLLERDVVAVQENGIRLTALLLDYDPTIIAAPSKVKHLISDLRSDPVISIDKDVFDRIDGALSRIVTSDSRDSDADTAGITSRSSSSNLSDTGASDASTSDKVDIASSETQHGSQSPAAGSSQNDPTNTTSGKSTEEENETEVFDHTSNTEDSEIQQNERDDTGTTQDSTYSDDQDVSVSFCPECGENLDSYNNPTFCPECGWSLTG